MRNLSESALKRSGEMRKSLSPCEALLWSKLKGKSLGFVVRRQFPVGPYFLDFYVPSAKLCIEVDGAEHEWRESEDFTRDAFLASEGIRTLRFYASEVSRDWCAVARTIEEAVRATVAESHSGGNGPPPQFALLTGPPPPAPPQGKEGDA